MSLQNYSHRVLALLGADTFFFLQLKSILLHSSMCTAIILTVFISFSMEVHFYTIPHSYPFVLYIYFYVKSSYKLPYVYTKTWRAIWKPDEIIKIFFNMPSLKISTIRNYRVQMTLDTLHRFSTIFYKGDNFCDFQFVFLNYHNCSENNTKMC